MRKIKLMPLVLGLSTLFPSISKADIEKIIFRINATSNPVQTCNGVKSYGQILQDLDIIVSQNSQEMARIHPNDRGIGFVNLPPGEYSIGGEGFKSDPGNITIDGQSQEITINPQEQGQISGKITKAEGAFGVPIIKIKPFVYCAGGNYIGYVKRDSNYCVFFPTYRGEEYYLGFSVEGDGKTFMRHKSKLFYGPQTLDVWLAHQSTENRTIAGTISSNIQGLGCGGSLILESNTEGLMDLQKKVSIQIDNGTFQGTAADGARYTAHLQIPLEKIFSTPDFGSYSLNVSPGSFTAYSDTICNFDASVPEVTEGLGLEISVPKIVNLLWLYLGDAFKKPYVDCTVTGTLSLSGSNNRQNLQYPISIHERFTYEEYSKRMNTYAPLFKDPIEIPPLRSGFYNANINIKSELDWPNGGTADFFHESLCILVIPGRENVKLSITKN